MSAGVVQPERKHLLFRGARPGKEYGKRNGLRTLHALRMIVGGRGTALGLCKRPHRRAHRETDGARFRSESDTEVILEMYARQGAATVKRLRGMFAFAIYDRKEEDLFLARDRMGIKPLYLWRFPGGIAFASEIRALRALPGGPSTINRQAIREFLHWGSVPLRCRFTS